jgi:hypothetical protein
MTDTDWQATWRAWLRARFGERLDEARLEALTADCEALRAVWAPLLEAGVDNAELPFPNALPGPGAAGDSDDAEGP